MNCDPLAHWYRWLEYVGFGRALERRRLEFLGRCRDATKVMMLGEGDGRFLAAFLRVNYMAEVDYVDSSREMLMLTQRRVGTLSAERPGNADRVHLHHSDALLWLRESERAAGSFDLVTFHFFLDCFNEDQLKLLVDTVAKLSVPKARWIVSEFRYERDGWAALWTRCLVGGLYLFFRIVTGLETRRLADHAAAFQAAGFRRTDRVVAGGGSLVSECWERS